MPRSTKLEHPVELFSDQMNSNLLDVPIRKCGKIVFELGPPPPFLLFRNLERVSGYRGHLKNGRHHRLKLEVDPL